MTDRRIRILWALLRLFFTAAALFGVWILFTMRFGFFTLCAGGIGALTVSAITYRIFIPEHDASLKFFFPNPLFLIIFFFSAVFYLYVSSYKMLLAVVSGKVNPRIVHFRTRLRSDLARMVLAEAITLTPGTITLDLNDDHLTVHWFFLQHKSCAPCR